MILRGWHMDGFGVFHDARVDGLPDGVSVLLGPNETGKSTLLAFIRGVLFGFPDRRHSAPRYEPVHGGRHGGRLFVESAGQAYTLERHAGRGGGPALRDADGNAVPEGVLERILGGADATLFNHIFGFSLDELQALRSLTGESVRDRIFSGAVAGAGRSANLAQEALRKQADALYKPDGRSRRNHLAGLLESYRETERALAEARREAEAYPHRVEAEAEAERRAADARRRLDALQAERAHLARLQRLWPPWNGREAALRALEAERHAPFDRTADVRPDAAFTTLADEAAHLAAQADAQRERLALLGDDDAALREKTEQIRGRLETLGDAWTEEAAEAFTFPIPERETVRQWEAALERARRAVTEAERVLAGQQEQAERAEREHRDAAAALDAWDAEPPDVPALDARQRTLEALRSRLAERARARERVARLRDAWNECRHVTLDRQRRRPRRLWYPGVAVLAGALVAAGAALMALGLPGAGGMLAGVGVLAGGLGAGVVALWRRRAANDIATARGREREAAARLDEARREAEGVDAAVAEQLAAVGLDADADDAAVAEALADAHATRDARRRWEAACKAAEAAEAEAERAREARDTAQRARDDAVEEERRLQAEWADWKAENGLPGTLTPQGVIDFAETLKDARDQVAEKRRLAEQRQQRAEAAETWASAARSVLERRGRESALSGAALVDAFAAEAEAIARERDHYRAVAEAEDAIAREAGHDPERMAALKAALVEGDPDTWGGRVAELDDAVQQAEAEWEQAAGDQRQARDARERLEQSADVAAHETRLNALAAEIAQAYRRWQTLTTAHKLVEKTLRTYEQERQPAVVARAGEHFARVTGGRYDRVVQTPDGGMDVLDSAGRRVGPDGLSRGTREQLYLSVRLGLAAEFARRGTALPLVMDEILVNFDPDRMAAMARELHEVARDHQVLLFTCHPFVAETVQRAGPTRVIEGVG